MDREYLKKILLIGLAGAMPLVFTYIMMLLRGEDIRSLIIAFEMSLFCYACYVAIAFVNDKKTMKMIDYLETKNKKLQRANAMNKLRRDEMMKFFIMWIHQIKTPITALKLLLKGSNASPDVDEQLINIEKYTAMALGYAKIYSNDYDFYPTAVTLDKVIRPIIQKYAPVFISSDISLSYIPIEAKVITDSRWLGLAIEQLISNATKYAKGGSVTIEFNELKKQLHIKDTGIGISAADFPKIFDKGFSGENGLNHGNSSGLGLYLAKELLDRMGHGITADSHAGEGSDFTIQFPYRNADVLNEVDI